MSGDFMAALSASGAVNMDLLNGITFDTGFLVVNDSFDYPMCHLLRKQ